MATSPSSILELSRQISALTEQTASYLSEKNLPEPSFHSSYEGIPEGPEFEKLQGPLVQALIDLQLLIQGPKIFLRTFGCSLHDLAAFQVACEFNFFEIVPLNGSITTAKLAKATGLAEDITGTVIRLLATQRMFNEVEQDVFEHTSLSAPFARDNDIKAGIHME
ncbi:MAG: hypothetical protein MMC23_005284 [Stictis urceolatum]|nr:hypothetical protein [Stictis urceolata]